MSEDEGDLVEFPRSTENLQLLALGDDFVACFNAPEAYCILGKVHFLKCIVNLL